MTFGERLRAWRDFRSLTLTELGRAAGIHHKRIHRIELDQQEARESDLVRLSSALGVSAGTLLEAAPPEVAP